MDASSDIMDELQNLQEELKRVKRKNELIEKDNKDFLSKLEQAARWGQKLLEENTELKEKVKESNHTNIHELREEFKDTMRQMEEQMSKLELENEKLKSSGGGAEGGAPSGFDRPKLQRGMTEAMRQNEEALNRIEELEAENRHLRHKIEQDEQAIDTLEKQAETGGGIQSTASQGFSAKSAFHSALGLLQRDHLHKRLEEEASRAEELEMQLRNMQVEGEKVASQQEKLKQEFAEIQKFAQQQRALKYGAQAQLQDFEVKNDTLQQELARMQNKMRTLEDPNASHGQKVQVLKASAPALNSLYADLKAGVDDIAWLTTEDDSDDSDDDSDDSELGDPSMYSKYLETYGKGDGEGSQDHSDKVPLPHGATKDDGIGEVGEDTGGKPPKSAYSKKMDYGKGGKIPSAYDGMSKRERKVVKMTINETHKKLLQAFRLIEVLQQHVQKLTEELEYLEGVAQMAKNINWAMGVGFVALSSLVIFLFAFFRIWKCDD